MRKQILLSAVALGAIVGFARNAAAQESANPPTIEELVVTAEKREQSLQDIPLAVSAYPTDVDNLPWSNGRDQGPPRSQHRPPIHKRRRSSCAQVMENQLVTETLA